MARGVRNMSMSKKLLSIFVSAAMVFGFMNLSSLYAFAAEANAEDAAKQQPAEQVGDNANNAVNETGNSESTPQGAETDSTPEATTTPTASESLPVILSEAKNPAESAASEETPNCTGGADCNHVATVEGAHYATLQEALNAAPAETTVALIADATENVTVGEDANVTLDLAGHTLNGGTVASKAALTNKGIITIKDSATGGTIKREDNNSFGYYTVENQKNMTIAGGTITNNSNKSSLVINFNNQGGNNFGAVEGVVMNITGGTLTQSNCIALKADPNTKMNISGGTISGNTASNFYGDVTITGGNVTLNGVVLVLSHKNASNPNEYAGSFNIKGGNVACADIKAWNGWSGGLTSINPAVNISGGNVNVSGTVELRTKDAAGAQAVIVDKALSTISLSAGTYTNDVANYCATDFKSVLDSKTNKYVVSPRVYVAQIGNNKYETLGAAANASVDGDTITLLADWARTSYTSFGKSITLDLNGKLINSNHTTATIAIISGANVTIKNGKIAHVTNACSGAIYVYQGAVTLENVAVTSNSYGIMVGRGVAGFYGKLTLNAGSSVSGSPAAIAILGDATNNQTNSQIKTEVTINEGATVTGTTYGIAGNGSTDDTVITVNGGSITAKGGRTGEAEYAAGIYHPQQGTLTINGGTISGKVGVQMAAGNAIINGGKLVSTDTSTVAAPFKAAAQGDGMVLDGAALSMVSRSAYGNISVEVKGGSFESALANESIKKYGMQKTATAWEVIDEPTTSTLAITNGTFSSCPEAKQIAADLIGVKKADGQYVIEQKPEGTTEIDDSYKGETVAQVGGKVFGSIAAAVAAVANEASEVAVNNVVLPVAVSDKSAPEAAKVTGASIVLNKAAAAKATSALDADAAINVSIEQTESTTTNAAAFEIKVTGNDKNLLASDGTNQGIEITVKIPSQVKDYKYAYYVDENGQHTKVDEVVYENDCAVFTTNHLSTYKLSKDILNADGSVYTAPVAPVNPNPAPEAQAPAQEPVPAATPVAAPATATPAATDEAPAAAQSAAQAQSVEETIADKETPLASEIRSEAEFPVLPVVGIGLLVIIAGAVLFMRRKALK